jgi:hypothetical protein
MWDPQRLTTLWAFTACYRDSFLWTFYENRCPLPRVTQLIRRHHSLRTCMPGLKGPLPQTHNFRHNDRSYRNTRSELPLRWQPCFAFRSISYTDRFLVVLFSHSKQMSEDTLTLGHNHFLQWRNINHLTTFKAFPSINKVIDIKR